jgi:uroporphyrinogen-III decarboxylase
MKWEKPRFCRELTGLARLEMQDIFWWKHHLQGNFDPSRLLSPIPVIKKMVHEMIDEFGKDKYIVNLGHGILPNIPDHAKAFIDAVKEYNQ